MKKNRSSLHENNLVVQSNSLIESSYNLTVSEQKIILSIISLINPGDKDFAPYTFRILDFMKIAGIEDQSSYKRIRDLSKGLMEKVVTIKKPNSILYVNWFSSAEYFEGQGYVEIQVSPELKPYYLDFKNRFTQYPLKYIMQLKSFYSIRIYELLKQYESLNERTFELGVLRDTLGISPNVYKLYTGFRDNVIIVAQKELAEKADIFFTFEEIKKGKKVDKIRFVIFKNQKVEVKQLTFDTSKPLNFDIPDSIIKVIPEKERINSTFKVISAYLLREDAEDYIISNILYTVKYAKKFLVYLKKALHADYAQAERELFIQARMIAKQRKKLEEEQTKFAEEKAKAEKERIGKEDEQIFILINQLPEHERAKIEILSKENMKKFPPIGKTIDEEVEKIYKINAYKLLNNISLRKL